MTDNYPMFEWVPGVLITYDVSEEDTPIRAETEVNNNEPEGELNVEEANENNYHDEAEDVEDNNDNNEIEINIKEKGMYITEYKDESDDQ